MIKLLVLPLLVISAASEDAKNVLSQFDILKFFESDTTGDIDTTIPDPDFFYNPDFDPTNFFGTPLRLRSGLRVFDNDHSLTIGPRGPILLSDFYLQEKLTTFVNERTPERLVHAKGAMAHGVFTLINDMSQYTKAVVFNGAG